MAVFVVLISLDIINEKLGISHVDIANFATTGELNIKVCEEGEQVSIFELAKLLGSTASELQEMIKHTENKKAVVSLKKQFQAFEYPSKPKVLEGFKGMSIKATRKEKVIQLRDSKFSAYFELIRYPSDHLLTIEDEKLIKKAHERFRARLEAQSPWRDRNYLLSGSYREIKTFKDLLEFYKEGLKDKNKLNRLMTRYFSGMWGERLLSTYCAETFREDYLERAVSTRKPSDRNEVIKIISAAINKAKGSMNIKVDVQQLVDKGERARADKTDNKPPLLSTVILFILTAFERDYKKLGLELIIQFMVSTRVANTDSMKWKQVKFKEKCVEIPQEESKTGFRKLPAPQRLLDIMATEYARQLDARASEKPIYVFESPKIKGKPIANMNDHFQSVKNYLLANAVELGLMSEEVEDIKRFTRHAIRDLVEDELMTLNASEAQKEKCLGRKPNEIGLAYGNLDLAALSKLKDRMVKRAEECSPKLKILFKDLIDKEVSRC